MVEKILIVEPFSQLRRKITGGIDQAVKTLDIGIQVCSTPSLVRAEALLDLGDISLLMTNLNLSDDGLEGLSLVNRALIPSPRAPRERICVYADKIPAPDVPAGVIQISIVKISTYFLQSFIRGLTINAN